MGSSDSTPVHLTDVEGIVTGTIANPSVSASVGLTQEQLPHTHKFGFVDSANTSPTSIREGQSAGTLFAYLSADTSFEVVSSSGSDTDVDVTIEGVDNAGAQVTATANTDGASPAAFSAQAQDVYRAYVSGPTPCVGTLTIRVAGAGQTMATISPVHQQSNISAFTIPAGKTGTLNCATGSMGRTDDGVIYIAAQEPGGVFRTKDLFKSGEGATIRDYTCGGLVDGINNFAAGTRIEGRCVANTGTIDAGLSFLVTLKDA